MRSRLAVGCALVLAAAAPGFAQDWFEPNPSLARLSADDAFARTSARSLQTAGIAGAAVAIRLDDAGRVVVAGGWFNDRQRIARLDAAGRLDPTFGVGGVAELPVEGGVGGLEIDADGRIVVTGAFAHAAEFPYPWSPGYAGPWYGAARLRADGSLDPDFSGDGLLELDAASGLHGLGAVHASGGDGAMLALAQKAGRAFYEPVFGLVRIAADGTIDATYGGGFAQVAQGPSADYLASVIVSVTDFAVDSTGRALVPVAARNVSGFTVRLDTAGGLDTSFWNPGDYYSIYLTSNFTASQIAIDGAGRIVGLEFPELFRRLPDGAGDHTFAGDGYAWHLGFADANPLFNVNERDSGELIDDLAVLAAAESADPDLDGEPFGGREFLAVATRADRWALAKLVEYHDAKGDVVAHGIGVQAIDPADPGAIVSTTYRSPDRSFGNVAGLAIATDGSAAYALGDTFVLRVDLATRKALPLPDLRVKWLGWPHAVDFAGGRYRVTARVRVRNVSSIDASVVGDVAIGDGSFDGPLHPLVPLHRATNATKSSRPFTLRRHSSVVRRFTWEGTYGPADLAGARLSIRVRSELPDANPADNTATSRTISPLYSPR